MKNALFLGFYTNLREAGFQMGYSNMAFGVVVGLNLLGLFGFMRPI